MMRDPGFVSGLIGWVMGFVMGLILQQIKIVLSFPEQLRKLEKQAEKYAMFFGQNSTPHTEVEKIFEKASVMVKSGRAVLPFDFISRYLLCRRISTLISEIDEIMPMTLYIYIGAAPSLMKQAEVAPPVKNQISAADAGEVHVSMPADEKKGKVHLSNPADDEDSEVVSTNFITSSTQRFQYSRNPVVTATAGKVTAPAEEEVNPRNRGFFSRFIGITLKRMLEHSNADLGVKKQLASLEYLVKRIRPTITIIKERVNSSSSGNGSVVQAWIEQLEEVLRNADELNKHHRGRFIFRRETRKRISGSISEINALLKWGQVIISLECFKN